MPPSLKTPDPALARFLDRLRGIVTARNYLALERLIRPEFRVEFDAGHGPAAFRRYWRSQFPDSPVWPILERLLTLPGSSYSPTLFAVPYVFARFPFDLDPLSHVVAIRDAVGLLAEPKADAANVGLASHEIIPLPEPMRPPVVIPADHFVELKHPDAGRCFAVSADVYHPAAHRAFFEKRETRWHWISLAAATLDDPPDLERQRSRARA